MRVILWWWAKTHSDDCGYWWECSDMKGIMVILCVEIFSFTKNSISKFICMENNVCLTDFEMHEMKKIKINFIAIGKVNLWCILWIYWACSCRRILCESMVRFFLATNFLEIFTSLCVGFERSVEAKNHSRRPQIIAIMWIKRRRKSFFVQ